MRIRAEVKIWVFGIVFSLGCAGNSYAQAPFYQGKTITLVQGRAPGGSGDTRSKVVAPFLQKHIPGNPTIVSEYMAGAGGRKAANHLFNTARPDGLTIGHVSGGVVTSAVLGEGGVQYDLDKFNWLGSPDSAYHYVLMVRKELGLTNVEKLQAYSGLKIGAQSIGHTSYTQGRTFAWVLGLKDAKFLVGYGSLELDMAVQRGEADARSNNTAEVLRRNPDAFEKGPYHFVVVFKTPRDDKDPQFDNLPEIDNFLKSEKERRVVGLIRSLRLVGTPYIIPPGTPKERVEILREGIRKTFRDPEFRKEFKKMTGDDPTPLMPEAQEQAIKALPRDPETIELFKKLNASGPLPPR
jgi:tripartite-type tricarboxylate transporter receptor subunit TctC